MKKIKNVAETFPLYHTGYMTGRDVFSVLICQGMIKVLESYLNKENICILNEEVLKKFYRELQRDKLLMISEQTVEKARDMYAEEFQGFGICSSIMDYTDWNIMAGSYAYDLFSTINSGKEIYRCLAAELTGGRVILLDFLEPASAEELARIVRFSVYKLAKRDITGSNPQIESEHIRAVRPPYDEWGMIIYR